MAALEKGLKELAAMIGGEQAIASVVTDRHSAVIKMMSKKFPRMDHYFDAWHYFRNIVLTLLDVCD